MERYIPESPEEEPYANLDINEGQGEFRADRFTTRLYTHLGRLALYDHIYCNDNETSFYIWKAFSGGYDQMATFMVEHDFPMYLNQTEISSMDIEAFDRTMKRIADVDHIPDDWV